MRYELKKDGVIDYNYTGAWQKVNNIPTIITNLFSQNNYTCKITKTHASVYTILVTNNVDSTTNTYDIFFGNIRNESRSEGEKKIQLNGKDPRFSTNTAIILGAYCYDANDPLEDLIFAAWYVEPDFNYPTNPSIRGINIDLFQKAKFNGLKSHSYRNNTVLIFRPEFIFYYLKNRELFHAKTGNSLLKIDSPLNDISRNKIYYGAPGTGKSYIVDKLTDQLEDMYKERITFHPEYDYTSFVGGYRPFTDEADGDKIKYQFVPQALTNIYVKAWKDPVNQYYLIIEEINRGNSAEIFGDLFQLLDRNSNYSISPSVELKGYLNKKLKIIGNDGIKGNKMKLPKNLVILATMNTSDQSLFPMDSAFKRRWDWEYVPICYEKYYSDGSENKSFNFKVILSDSESFKWIDFINKVNEKIISVDGLGMDKCIGNYFVNPSSNEIGIKEFINKAIFYLWNDVFKDESDDNNIFMSKTSYEKFFPIDSSGIKEIKSILGKLSVDIEVQTKATEN